MDKLKVTVEFQNAFCDKLYNAVQHAEFEWLEKYFKDKEKVELWRELIGAVDNALFSVVKEFFDNSGESELEKRVKALEDYNEQQRQRRIQQLEAENKMLEQQLKNKGMPSLEEFLRLNNAP